jgi:signal transduction histidine kinase
VAGEALKLQARVQDVLDVASGAREVGDGEATLDPAAEAAAAAEDALPAARAAGLAVEVAPHLGGPLARGHAPVVRRALAAVLDNGVKFAGRGALRVHVEHGDGEVRIVVDDEGPGIPAADRERVFDPFVRLEEGRARARDGSGLGLALARRCMEACGGGARVEEAPGGGARVVLVLREAEGAHDPAR